MNEQARRPAGFFFNPGAMFGSADNTLDLTNKSDYHIMF
jgi:hypothetical protein